MTDPLPADVRQYLAYVAPAYERAAWLLAKYPRPKATVHDNAETLRTIAVRLGELGQIDAKETVLAIAERMDADVTDA